MGYGVTFRSIGAVTDYCELIGLRPDYAFVAGPGVRFAESRMMCDRWGPGFPIFGWEPHPHTYEGIRSAYPGELVNRALGAAADESSVVLHLKHRHADGSSLWPSSESDTTAQPVEVETLEHAWNARQPDGSGLLWLDCEGSELSILRSGLSVLEHFSVINVELTGAPPHDDWPRPQDVHDLLTAGGFVRSWIHTTRTQIAQYDAVYVSAKWATPLRIW